MKGGGDMETDDDEGPVPNGGAGAVGEDPAAPGASAGETARGSSRVRREAKRANEEEKEGVQQTAPKRSACGAARRNKAQRTKESTVTARRYHLRCELLPPP